MALTPWYKVVTPREDLRQQRPLDAAEFAVHLDQVREGRAPSVYQDPNEFFDRTYLTRKLKELGVEVVRRLSGEVNDASAIFNLATQFGGGKTHALAMLFHLAQHGQEAQRWRGVSEIVDLARVPYVPRAATAVFVGQQFDALRGRGGDDGTPLRRTPWGEIAWQLGGEASFAVVGEHDAQGLVPGGDVIRAMLPQDSPCLILMDELMNYISRYRRDGLSGQFYDFLQNLSEEARSRSGMVLAVSIPASEIEMSADDERDYQTLKKLLDRIGKPLIISSENETAEIIRRRLFEWQGVNEPARKVVDAYTKWVSDHNQQLPEGWTGENARDSFAATYPFHPTVLSVFERKWQALPRFQRTRGVLQLLARWVSKAYQEGFSGAQQDLLIDLGTAPLDDPDFRAVVFEQLGEERLEAAVTTDIAGRANSHSTMLDANAQQTIRDARLYRKIAATIFFESNGGQFRAEATVPEIRLAVGFPTLDISNIETSLDILSETCYFLSTDRNRYRFSTRENLIKKHADYRSNIAEARIADRTDEEIRNAFNISLARQELPRDATIGVVFFPDSSSAVPNDPQVTLVVLSPSQGMNDLDTLQLISEWTNDFGVSARIFKNALIWCVAEDATGLRDAAKKAIAWEDILSELEDTPHGLEALDDVQRRQLNEYLRKSQSDLRESVWRTYRYIVLLGNKGDLQTVNLGLVHSSAATTPINLIVNRLIQQGDVEIRVGASFLVRKWPAFPEWSTRSVKNSFFASPQFPRLLSPNAICETIASGVSLGHLAYVSYPQNGEYTTFYYKQSLSPGEVEILDDMCIIRPETAEAYLTALDQPLGDDQLVPAVQNNDLGNLPQLFNQETEETSDDNEAANIRQFTLHWHGDIPAQKWSMFYNKILSRFAVNQNLRLSVEFEARPPNGISQQGIEETKLSLRELGLNDDLETE